MFEATFEQGSVLKKLVDAIKDLIESGNLDVSREGIALQAMDTSHVCLVALMLRADGFRDFRCDRNLMLGVHLSNLAKVLKCANNEDAITLRAQDSPDTLGMLFESKAGDRVSEFEIKLMDIESEQLGIPESEYAATITMPSAEYARISKDLASIGDTVTISATKEGVRFSTSGDVGTANVLCRHSVSADKPEQTTSIELREPVSLNFSLRFINSFAKASGLSSMVKISMHHEMPIVVEYTLSDVGYIRFYLAPKIDDEDDNMGGGGEDE